MAGNHWIYKTAQIARIGWFIFHILVLGLFFSHLSLFWLLMTLLFAAFLIPQWSGRSYPLLELLFSGVFLIIGCFLLGKYSSFLAFPALCAGLYSKPGKGRWILWGGFSIVPFLTYVTIGLDQIGMGVIDGLFFYSIGVMVAKVLETENKMKSLLEENRQQNLLLEEYAKQIEKITLLEERNRLAKELHDTVGHTFTSVIMGLDAASYLTDVSPEKAKEQIDRLGGVMRKSLDEVRNYIHQISPLSEEKEDLSSQLKKVADEFALHTKIDIEFKSIGLPVMLSFQGTVALIRCLQESLTNAVRHGRAKEINISLQQAEGEVMLTIRDNGSGMSAVKEGFGLRGMKERLEFLQGGMKLESKPGQGTVVTCFIPVRRRVEHDQSVNCG
jgi:signal transduction histidine kinase